MTAFTILLGGDLTATDRLRRQVAGTSVIAADSGIRHARALGLDVDLWVGDFDSVDHEERLLHGSVPVEPYPEEKDVTDGEIAIAAALSRGATSLMLAGAFGGARADHAFLHLAAALRLAEDGTTVLLSSGTQEGVPVLPGPARSFDYPGGTLFSVIGFTDLEGLDLAGVHWPLVARDVPFGSSLTLSNRVTGNLEISLKAGRAMLVAHLES